MYKVSIFNSGAETIIHYPDADEDVPKLKTLHLNKKRSQAGSLTFSIPINSPGYKLLTRYKTLIRAIDTRDNTVKFEGRVLTSVEKMSTEGLFYKEVVCEGLLNYLLDSRTREYVYEDLKPIDVLRDLLTKHNLKVEEHKKIYLGNVTVTEPWVFAQTNFETTLEAINKYVIDESKGFLNLRETNGLRYLDYISVGSENVVDIILGENMKELIVENNQDFGTRIIPIGEDNLTIDNVNGGKDYIDDEMPKSIYGIIERTVEYKDINNDTELKEVCLKDLKEYTQPKLVLQCSALDLSVLTGTSVNSFDISTTLHIINPAMGIDGNYKTIELDVDLLQPWNPKLAISNKTLKGSDTISSFKGVSEVVNKITTSKDQVNTRYLDGVINALKNQLVASGSYKNAQVIPNKGMLLENVDRNSSDYGALYIGPGIFSVANSKNADGTWNWRTFGTGGGFTADEITAGTINAEKINVTNLNANNITAGTISGDRITGGTIEGTLMKTSNSGDYVEIANQFVECKNNGNTKVKIGYFSIGSSNRPVIVLGSNERGKSGFITLYDDSGLEMVIGLDGGYGLKFLLNEVQYKGSELATKADIPEIIDTSNLATKKDITDIWSLCLQTFATKK